MCARVRLHVFVCVCVCVCVCGWVWKHAMIGGRVYACMCTCLSSAGDPFRCDCDMFIHNCHMCKDTFYVHEYNTYTHIHTCTDSPGPPNISNVIQLATTVAVSWTPPTSGGTVRSYWIYVGGLIRSLPSNTTSVALQLSAGSRYTILIVALGRHLPSPPSPVVVEMGKCYGSPLHNATLFK